MTDNKDLVEVVKNSAKEMDGKTSLTCARAHQIVEENNTTLGVIGNICNENGIKIRNCQLGCFK